MWVVLIIIGIIVIGGVISRISETISNAKNYLKMKPEYDRLHISISEHNKRVDKDREEWKTKAEYWNNKVQNDKNVILFLSESKKQESLDLFEKIAEEIKEKDEQNIKNYIIQKDELRKIKNENLKEIVSEKEKLKKEFEQNKHELEKIATQKSMGFPWLAEAYAEYFFLKDLQTEEYLKSKPYPAVKKSEEVHRIKDEKKMLEKDNRILKYKIQYYEDLFPSITDFIGEDENDEIPVIVEDELTETIERDKVKDLLTPEEYIALSPAERNQKALDKYIKGNKTKWQIGRDYEMSVGYHYEQQEYIVEYTGIAKKLEDLGIDLIAKKGNEILLIQCKRWRKEVQIHEKHIFQLFGTTIQYWIHNFPEKQKQKTFEEFKDLLVGEKIRPIFITSTTLSETAQKMADALSVEVINLPMQEFPRIKCNISRVDGKKIYHLPFDQQYDRTIVEKDKGESHVFTVKEAEDRGFRRAFKHNFT